MRFQRRPLWEAKCVRAGSIVRQAEPDPVSTSRQRQRPLFQRVALVPHSSGQLAPLQFRQTELRQLAVDAGHRRHVAGDDARILLHRGEQPAHPVTLIIQQEPLQLLQTGPHRWHIVAQLNGDTTPAGSEVQITGECIVDEAMHGADGFPAAAAHRAPRHLLLPLVGHYDHQPSRPVRAASAAPLSEDSGALLDPPLQFVLVLPPARPQEAGPSVVELRDRVEIVAPEPPEPEQFAPPLPLNQCADEEINRGRELQINQ